MNPPKQKFTVWREAVGTESLVRMTFQGTSLEDAITRRVKAFPKTYADGTIVYVGGGEDTYLQAYRIRFGGITVERL